MSDRSARPERHVVLVELSVAAERAAEFMPLMLANAAASLRDEPGCRQFDVSVTGDGETEILLYEVYDSAGAFQQHLRTQHFLDFDRVTATMVLRKVVKVATLRTVPSQT